MALDNRDEIQLKRELIAVDRAQEYAAEKMRISVDKGNVEMMPYKSTVMRQMLVVADEIVGKLANYKPGYKVSRVSDRVKLLREFLTEANKVMDVSVLVCDYILGSLATKPRTITTLGQGLGRRIFRAYRMALFIKDNPHYYEEMKRFLQEQRVGSFDGIYKRFEAGARVGSIELDTSAIAALGSWILNEISTRDDSFIESVVERAGNGVRQKMYRYVYLSCDIYEVMQDIVDNTISGAFDRAPMFATPLDWTYDGERCEGGFFTAFLRHNTPVVLGNPDRPVSHIPKPYLDALNKLQRTAYGVNTKVMEVTAQIFRNNLQIGGVPRSLHLDLTEIPADMEDESLLKELRSQRREEHIENTKIFSKGMGLASALQQCTEAGDGPIHFVHSLCYRGRMYCMSTGLTTQGTDCIKGLLKFHEGKPLGKRGLYWLKVRAANTLGFDKAPLDERVAYIDERIPMYSRIYQDPLTFKEYWADADKPTQYLATVFEIHEALQGNPEEYVSYLPVGLDGSCNGSQHLAILSGDAELAKGVNVTPSDTFQDIYQDVADDMWEHSATSDTYQLLLSKGLTQPQIAETFKWMYSFEKPPRKLVKRAVMTVPYGSTVRGRMDFVRDFVKDTYTGEHKNRVTLGVATIMEKSLLRKTAGAIKSMEMLQATSVKAVDETGTFAYTTPLGLVVNNFAARTMRRHVKILGYSVNVNLPTDVCHKSKVKSCSAPNFIHSMDACHLIKVINHPEMTSLMAIHDDIGTHAGETEDLFRILREEFIDLYDGKDFFKQIKPDYERKDVVNVQDVADSQFFFC